MSIIYDLSYDDYARELAGWRWSQIKMIERGSMLDVRHSLANPEASDSYSRQELRAMHCIALEPESFDAGYIAAEVGDRRAKAYKDAVADSPGFVVFPRPVYDRICALGDAIRRHPEARALLADCRAEVSLTWTDERTGLKCKGRLDALTGAHEILDLKGIGVYEGQVSRISASNGYHGQVAHYDYGARANDISPAGHYIISYQDKPPFDVAVWRMEDGGLDGVTPGIDGLTLGGALHHGRRYRDDLMQRFVEALRNEEAGGWTGRHASTQDLILPGWAMRDDEIMADDDIDADGGDDQW